MFYIHGGASDKKRAIREIFKPSSKHPDGDDNGDGDETNDNENERDKPRPRSRSRSRSRAINRTEYTTNSEDDTVTDSNTDTESNMNDTASHDEALENHDYITTLGSINTDGHHHNYQFADNELEYDIEEFTIQHPEIIQYDIVIYRINTNTITPFLEFLFYCENMQCTLPRYKHVSKKHIRKECDDIMNQLFTTKYRYKGYFYDEITGKCYILYEKYFRQEVTDVALLSLRKNTNWFWISTTEIIHHRKYMTIPIHDDAIDLFLSYPLIGILHANVPSSEYTQVSRRDERFHAVMIEVPSILYYGSTLCYAETTAMYGLKREPIISRFGPFYYFTTLEHSYYWACYHNTRNGFDTQKHADGGISRYAVFTKRMKTAFDDDDYQIDMVKKYVERKNIFETKINQYRQTQETYHHDRYDSIYSYDYTWTENYDTIYNGYYDSHKRIRPVWCVCDDRQFQLLSYYEVDTTKIPTTYDPTFSEYIIL
jgi:hypothetical protein